MHADQNKQNGSMHQPLVRGPGSHPTHVCLVTLLLPAQEGKDYSVRQRLTKTITNRDHSQGWVTKDMTCFCRSGRVRVLAPDGAVCEYVPPAVLSSGLATPGTWTRTTPSGLPIPNGLEVPAGCSDHSPLSATIEVCCVRVCLQ